MESRDLKKINDQTNERVNVTDDVNDEYHCLIKNLFENIKTEFGSNVKNKRLMKKMASLEKRGNSIVGKNVPKFEKYAKMMIDTQMKMCEEMVKVIEDNAIANEKIQALNENISHGHESMKDLFNEHIEMKLQMKKFDFAIQNAKSISMIIDSEQFINLRQNFDKIVNDYNRVMNGF